MTAPEMVYRWIAGLDKLKSTPNDDPWKQRILQLTIGYCAKYCPDLLEDIVEERFGIGPQCIEPKPDIVVLIPELPKGTPEY